MDLQEVQTRLQKYYARQEDEAHAGRHPPHAVEEEKDDNNDTAFTAAIEAAPEEEEDPATGAAATTARITIRYCPHAHYLFRAVYYGQELCTTFSKGELQ